MTPFRTKEKCEVKKQINFRLNGKCEVRKQPFSVQQRSEKTAIFRPA
jgi:hypothetical protein